MKDTGQSCRPERLHKTARPCQESESTMEPGRRVVLYAGLGVGHLTPMVELAKLFLCRGLAVIIAVPTRPGPASVASLAAANPSVSFHLLPPPPYPDPDPSQFVRMLDTFRLCAPSLLALLRSLPSVAALVVDMFCAHAVDVAAALNVPAYIYWTSSARAFASFLHLPYYYSKTASSLGDMGKALLHFPGVPPIAASDMPSTEQDREGRAYKARTALYARVAQATGVLLNTFEWLEARAVKALREGACVPDRPTPPVYCVGPLVAAGTSEAGESERHACLAWLDAQPDRSVVFLCFGSVGAFSVTQLKEIARGLETSGHRFLWVVRSPLQDPSKFIEPRPEPDLEELLPDGFLKRTRERGLVVSSWAPQAEVLHHGATGAFVTHCGWNSALEGVTVGVPLLCWPQYAEQRLNKVLIVEEMKVGVVMQGYDEELVSAEEVEAKVRLVMESEEGKRLRERLAVAREKAADALMDGGPSRLAFDQFLKDLGRSK
ncbi:anthocyanidin 5,3-O-glucosyltransferase-like [Phragmites australis]|uniref:anthocyanidin 5,3-O-glucosyltransferase-like n=1 Tax=Phragmites australis TaxID=29695 RepID=UPI002D794CC5|nr:anthocyanidin 5,3-O-glucosyltransferase-like [Phragmites australis]